MNSTYDANINFVSHTSDQVAVNGAVSLSLDNSTVLSIDDLNPIGQFTLFALPIVNYTTWNGGFFTVGGVVIDDYDAVTNPNSAKFFVGLNRYALDYNYNGHFIALRSAFGNTVPEPGSLPLIVGSLVFVASVRRFRRT